MICLFISAVDITKIEYQLLCFWKTSHILDFKAVVTVLWEYFTMALPDSDLEKSRDAILLLGMCGASEVFVTQINILAINYWLLYLVRCLSSLPTSW